jgi:CubicO group peptidase (beta-lactamase class C family)
VISRRALIGCMAVAGASRWQPNAWISPPRSRSRSDELEALLNELVAKHKVPGAIVGLHRNGAVTAAATGIANLNTGAPFTTDTGFLTGSITKVWTTSLVMTFVDDGTIDIERPLIQYLPDFKLGDQAAARIITVRQLLNHSSGIDAGDLLLDLGDGPESRRRYAEVLAGVGQIHAPGAYSSYCNGGFILAGYLLERLTGQSWDQLLHDRIITPLGLRRTVTSTDDAVLFRTAIGSVPDPANPEQLIPTAKFLLPKSAAPAGATLITTVADNLAFAMMHARGGMAPNGTRVLSEKSTRAMATRTIGRPAGGGAFGLGWGVGGRPGATRLSHSGGSNGGIAHLALLPEAGIAYASFANSSTSYGFHGELQQRVLATVVPTEQRPAAPSSSEPAPGAKPVASDGFLGTFRRKSEITTVRRDGSRLLVDSKTLPEEFNGSEAYNAGQPRTFEVTPTAERELTSVAPVLLGMRATLVFLEPDSAGRFQLLYFAGRLARRTA